MWQLFFLLLYFECFFTFKIVLYLPRMSLPLGYNIVHTTVRQSRLLLGMRKCTYIDIHVNVKSSINKKTHLQIVKMFITCLVLNVFYVF